MRLALLLAIETAVLIDAHLKFARLLQQACELPRKSAVALALHAELGFVGLALLQRLLLDEPHVLLHPAVRACCAALLSALPPNAQWVRAALDQLARCLSQLPAQSGGAAEGASGQKSAKDMAVVQSASALAFSVQLLVETPLLLPEGGTPEEGGAPEGGGEGHISHQQYWLKRYGELPAQEL